MAQGCLDFVCIYLFDHCHEARTAYGHAKYIHIRYMHTSVEYTSN